MLLRTLAFVTSRRSPHSTRLPFQGIRVVRRTSTTAEDIQAYVCHIVPAAFESIDWNNLIGDDQSFRVFFCNVLKEYGNGVSKEVSFNYEMFKQQPPNSNTDLEVVLSRYEDHRQTSSGVVPCLAFGCFFRPLLPSIYSDETFRQLLRTASLIAGIDNDIQSQNKMLPDDDLDYVSVLVRVGGFSMDQAIERIYRRHEQLQQEYRQLSLQLASKYKGSAAEDLVLDWVQTVGPSQSRGFVSWQCHSKRYKNDKADSKSLLERLFPGQPYHLVLEDGSFQGMNMALHNELTKDTIEWARGTGLIHDNLLTETKLQTVDPALCALLLFHYFDDKCAKDVATLHAFCRFFICILVVDDFWEKPALHDMTKNVMFGSFDACFLQSAPD